MATITKPEGKVERIKRKLGNENSTKQPMMSLMNDRRICRGSTYARVPAQNRHDSEREIQKKKVQRANVVQEMSRRGPSTEATRKRQERNVQTEEYYEKLTTIVREYDAETQTPFAYERPPSPLFMPVSSGNDAGTQILEGELFDFDKEVIPVLEVIVGRTIEKALMEVLEEEELKAIEKRQAEFAALRHAELLEAQRMEGVEKRRSDEKERRKTQEKMRVTKEGVLRLKVLSRQLSKHVVAEVEADVFRKLQELGKFDEPQLIDVETRVLPNMMSRVAEEVALRDVSTRLVAELIHAACAQRTRRFTESRDEYFARKAVVEAVVIAAEKESEIICDIEQLEAERINEEKERMKLWEAYEDPITPEPTNEEEGVEDDDAAGGR
ncbi:Flagellar radial spoke protein, putative [Perkinsus marinus ATCC 50983]|uniref:Flagellar radial spoke protein, putative n=1 Tax=Perkinsus marinus (strain ATCC 50983 / TXsc) TaxID=423536 RepID=C5KGY7_PERM5|nr:Flagellar radial spoke protein, putative [Perkinsus marinus ATCC 50983]EER15849.1 Flagellar radial spoke protein, putative [Perkinsus marinus ATCC 50983]|eukprot:XP_002784053.1 Flagellar radial spoke protein, putative [Perkinsus marinus ATCC 50983]